MALKEKIITIEDGRDKGVTYKVVEMPVSRLEKWCCRALLALFRAELPADIADIAHTSNAVALAKGVMRGLSSLAWHDAEPLYDELLGQIYRVPDKGQAIPLRPDTLDLYISDVSTIYRLRMEALLISLDFFGGGEGLTSRLSQLLPRPDSGTTPMSQES